MFTDMHIAFIIHNSPILYLICVTVWAWILFVHQPLTNKRFTSAAMLKLRSMFLVMQLHPRLGPFLSNRLKSILATLPISPRPLIFWSFQEWFSSMAQQGSGRWDQNTSWVQKVMSPSPVILCLWMSCVLQKNASFEMVLSVVGWPGMRFFKFNTMTE